MSEILISPGFGAGWSTWASGDMARYIARYQPIIDFLKQGGEFHENDPWSNKNWDKPWEAFDEPGQSILKLMCLECQQKFGEMPYLGGADQLRVEYADPDSAVYEYDGNESLAPFGEGTHV